MEELAIFSLTALLLGCFIYIRYLQRDIDDKELTMSLLRSQIKVCLNELNSLRMKDFIYKKTNIYKYETNNPKVLEAVKYAMKKAHPDNGGNAEDFKKFRDLYDSMK